MKKLYLLLLLSTGIYSAACAQGSGPYLPPEFKDVAVRAFQTADPSIRQWFSDAASQHPEGRFDSSWTMKKLTERFGAKNISSYEGLFMIMMEYQRMMNKEARESRNAARTERTEQIAGKEKKLQTDNKNISQQKDEAAERADQQMQAAVTSYWLGVVSARASNNITVAASEKQDSTKTKLTNANRVVKPPTVTSGAATTDQRKEVNDAVTKLLAQVGDVNKIAGLR